VDVIDAENYLTEMKCINQTRGMLGFTGFYNGKKCITSFEELKNYYKAVFV